MKKDNKITLDSILNNIPDGLYPLEGKEKRLNIPKSNPYTLDIEADAILVDSSQPKWMSLGKVKENYAYITWAVLDSDRFVIQYKDDKSFKLVSKEELEGE